MYSVVMVVAFGSDDGGVFSSDMVVFSSDGDNPW